MGTDALGSTRYRFDEFELRPDQGELLRHGHPVPLQPQPLKVLTILVSRAGDLVRRAELIEGVWDPSTHVDFDRGLNFCIKQIRDALEDDASRPRCLQTVPRYGYRFVARVKSVPMTTGSSWRSRSTAALLVAGLVILGAVGKLSYDVAAPRSVEARAMEAFAKGRLIADTGSPGNAAQSIVHYEEAIAIDPDFAEAHLALAIAWSRASADPSESVALARRAVVRALSLDDGLAEGHALLATLKLYGDWDWEGADESYRRALELQPASAKLRHAYANFLTLMGRHEEAVSEIDRAMTIDPVSTAIKADAGWFYYQARRYDGAVELCELTLELDPENENARWCLLQAHRHAGDDTAALEAARQLAKHMDAHPPPLLDLAAFWRWYLDWLERNPHASTPTEVGLAYLAVGERDEAIRIFEQALDQHLSCVLAIAADPQLDPLRGDPSYERLLARVGLPSQDVR